VRLATSIVRGGAWNFTCWKSFTSPTFDPASFIKFRDGGAASTHDTHGALGLALSGDRNLRDPVVLLHLWLALDVSCTPSVLARGNSVSVGYLQAPRGVSCCTGRAGGGRGEERRTNSDRCEELDVPPQFSRYPRPVPILIGAFISLLRL
jgi:hypothetical protein